MDDAVALANPPLETLYERDFHAWGLKQAELLRAGRLAEIDIENIVEEIEGWSRSDKRELLSRLTVLLLHLLKWRYQSELRPRSWQTTVREQRRALRRLLAESPSLKATMTAATEIAYADGRDDAVDETNMPASIFPDTCPWSMEQIMHDAFWPTS